MQPLINSLCVQLEDTRLKINFGLARGIGSLAYAGISYAMGKILLKQAPTILTKSYIVLFASLFLWILFFRYEPTKKDTKEVQIKKEAGISLLKKYKKFLIFVVGLVCILFGHNLINQYMIQIVTSFGANSDVMGKGIFIAAVLELPVMFGFSKIKSKFSCGWLLCISAVFFTLKHILTF